MGKPFAVVALIVDDEGDILSISRRNVEGDIGLIGGKVEPDDVDAIDAVRREVREEVGIEIAREDLVHVYTRYDGRKPDDKICWCFFARAYKGRPRAMENGFKVRWVPWSALLAETNTFASYNQGLYAHLQENPLPAPCSTFSP